MVPYQPPGAASAYYTPPPGQVQQYGSPTASPMQQSAGGPTIVVQDDQKKNKFGKLGGSVSALVVVTALAYSEMGRRGGTQRGPSSLSGWRRSPCSSGRRGERSCRARLLSEREGLGLGWGLGCPSVDPEGGCRSRQPAEVVEPSSAPWIVCDQSRRRGRGCVGRGDISGQSLGIAAADDSPSGV